LNPNKLPTSNTNAYMKYSGIAFQIAILVGLAFFAGKWLDDKIGFEKPYIGMSMILMVFTLYMFKLYKELFNARK
jgi:hypothetical protein